MRSIREHCSSGYGNLEDTKNRYENGCREKLRLEGCGVRGVGRVPRHDLEFSCVLTAVLMSCLVGHWSGQRLGHWARMVSRAKKRLQVTLSSPQTVLLVCETERRLPCADLALARRAHRTEHPTLCKTWLGSLSFAKQERHSTINVGFVPGTSLWGHTRKALRCLGLFGQHSYVETHVLVLKP